MTRLVLESESVGSAGERHGYLTDGRRRVLVRKVYSPHHGAFLCAMDCERSTNQLVKEILKDSGDAKLQSLILVTPWDE